MVLIEAAVKKRKAWILKPDTSAPILQRYSDQSTAAEDAGRTDIRVGTVER